jgi:CheY-like chemotaxis protein
VASGASGASTACGPGEAPLVHADRTEIEQILFNLASNARDAMPTGGRLTIETRRAGGEIPGEGQRSGVGSIVLLTVSDTGSGMASETKARAFEPFFTTKAPGKGSGLGLSTVHAIVTERGGLVTLDSEPDSGTRVTIRFPSVAPAAPAVPEARGAAAAPLGGQETILLVEDDGDVRELVKEMLESAGYAVLAAARPSAAQQTCRESTGSIHLLVTDVVMPEMSGPELADWVRAERPGIGVLYMSGYPDRALDAELETPGSSLIGKPFKRSVLLQRVRMALDAADPRARAFVSRAGEGL